MLFVDELHNIHEEKIDALFATGDCRKRLFEERADQEMYTPPFDEMTLL